MEIDVWIECEKEDWCGVKCVPHLSGNFGVQQRVFQFLDHVLCSLARPSSGLAC